MVKSYLKVNRKNIQTKLELMADIVQKGLRIEKGKISVSKSISKETTLIYMNGLYQIIVHDIIASAVREHIWALFTLTEEYNMFVSVESLTSAYVILIRKEKVPENLKDISTLPYTRTIVERNADFMFKLNDKTFWSPYKTNEFKSFNTTTTTTTTPKTSYKKHSHGKVTINYVCTKCKEPQKEEINTKFTDPKDIDVCIECEKENYTKQVGLSHGY